MLKKIYISVLLLLIVAQTQALTLKEAVVETLETNPKIIEFMQNYKASRQDLEIADADYFPTLDLKGGFGYQDISNNNTGFEKHSDGIYETSLLFNQNLFDGFGTTYRVSTSEARVMAASYRFIEQANATAFDILGAYLNVLKEKELQEIAVQNIQINNKIFNKVQALYDTGMTTLSEKEKIESSLSLSRSNYFVSKNSYRDAKKVLQRVLGHYVDAQELNIPEFEIRLPLEREEALIFSIDNNPSIRVSDYEVIAAQEDYKEKQARYYPSIDAEVRQAFNNNLNGIQGEEDDFKAMLVLTYNLYNGGADSADIQKRRQIVNRELAIRNDLKRQLKEDFGFSWNAIEEIQNQAKHLKHYKQHSIKTLMLYTDEYEMGKRSLLDLLAAQNDLISAKKQIVAAKYSLLLKKYELLNTMSIMVPSILGGVDGLYSKVNLIDTNATQVQMGVGFSDNYKNSHRSVCENTLSETVSKLYGCEQKNSQIRRFSEFVYECKTQILEENSLKRLNSVIEDLIQSDISDKIITIVSHADSSGNAKDDLLLTQKQNQWVKDYMQKKGLDVQKIKLIAKGSSEPLWLDKIAGLSEQNCRTDIIISSVRSEENTVK